MKDGPASHALREPHYTQNMIHILLPDHSDWWAIRLLLRQVVREGGRSFFKGGQEQGTMVP